VTVDHTAERTGGEVLVEGLRRWGVEVVFGLPGVQLDGLFEGFALEPAIRVIHTRHEQATSYMADGYSRVTGKVGVCAVVPGPGLLNAAAGLATAYACGSRVLCLVGQVPAGDLGRGRGVLHELPDQHAVLNGVIGRSAHATSPDEIPGLVDAAFTALLGNERPRPHALQVGWDAMLQRTAAASPARPELPEAKRPDPALVQAAADRLSHAAHPVLVVGGGALGAGSQIATLAERLGAPVVMTTEGKGAVPASHPLALPMLAAPVLFDEADVVLVIGSRAHLSRGPLPVPPAAAVIRIDVDPGELDQSVKPTIAIESDAAEAAASLCAAIDATSGPSRDAVAERTAAAVVLGQKLSDGMTARFPELAHCCAQLRAAIPPGGVLVDEMTQVCTSPGTGIPWRRRGSTSGRAIRGRSASATRLRSGRRWGSETGPSSRSPATAASSTPSASWLPQRSTASASSPWSSETTLTATC
jgi:acetolactate synthase-1/2/3 large subunit